MSSMKNPRVPRALRRSTFVFALIVSFVAVSPAPAAGGAYIAPSTEPPDGPWMASEDLPGYRMKVLFTNQAGAEVTGRVEPVCIPETACVSGALAGRPEVFVRVVGPKPNGFLWPTLAKFSTSAVEIWLEQTATGETRYYLLPGASPGSDVLGGLFDREGFLPPGSATPARAHPRGYALGPRAPEPVELGYDDGEMDLALTYSADLEGFGYWLMRFEPEEAPLRIRGVDACWTRDSFYWSGSSLDFDAVVFAIDPATGGPGDLLAETAGRMESVPASSDGGRAGESCRFHRIPLEATVDGPFLAGVRYEPGRYPNSDGFAGFLIGTDSDAPLTEGWYLERGEWAPIADYRPIYLAGYRTLMIRVDGEEGEEAPDPPPPPPPPPAADPPPPPGAWMESPELPDFRFKVRVSAAGREIATRPEPLCVDDTLCVSAALPGRSELFLRVVGPKPNGFLWPTIVRFTTSDVEVWIERRSTGALRYYLLEGASPGSSNLSGLFDRLGFEAD
jgi:hypothetical protein